MRGVRLADDEKRQLKQLDLRRFMEDNLGHECKARSGGISYYISPFRDEKEPSFTVSYYKGEWRWRDWGGDEGKDRGDIFALVMRVWNVEFMEAARMLLASEFPSDYYQREAEVEALDKERKVSLARKIYASILKVNNISAIQSYFQGKGVNYHFQMGCALHNSFKEKKVYVAIPLPSPWNMRGLEMREIRGTGRKTLGEKTLWQLRRDPRRLLVSESVLDCLAGEIILGDNTMSLCSINGVTNVMQLREYLKNNRPDEAYLAFDNDPAGITARDKAVEIISETGTGIVYVEDHFAAGVKDLHRLLQKEIGLQTAQGECS